MSITAEQAERALAQAECLYTANEVEQAIDAMADAMAARIKNRDPMLVCVMNGGLVLTAALMARWHFPLQVDYIHATRYRNTTRGSQLSWLVEPHQSIEGKTVVLVDDIFDEGITLAAIVDWCRARGAREVISTVLLEKIRPRQVSVEVDFKALTVEDRYIFGYGMDYSGYLRNAPGIFALKES